MKLLLWVALSSAAVQAQSPRQNWNSLSALTAGAEIRVQLTGGKTIRGFFQTAAPDGIVVNAATSQQVLARKDVKRVQLKKPGHRGRNTLIGLGVGAGIGLATGAGLDAKAGDDGFGISAKIVLMCFGAVIGTVIGVAWPTGRWLDVYRAP